MSKEALELGGVCVDRISTLKQIGEKTQDVVYYYLEKPASRLGYQEKRKDRKTLKNGSKRKCWVSA